jgi:hypothetical protein
MIELRTDLLKSSQIYLTLLLAILSGKNKRNMKQKKIIPLKFLRKIKKHFCPLVITIRGHTLYVFFYN